MINLSRRKRRLHRTPKPPKMSSRRQFHRALRRHPAWPAVMEQAAARARAQESIRRNSAGAMEMGQASKRIGLRLAARRNRAGITAMLAVGALVALLTGLAVADGQWTSRDLSENNSPPGARFGAATTFDETNGEMLVFGGFGTSGTPVPDTGSIGPGNPVREIPGTGAPTPRNNTWGFKGRYTDWIDRNPVRAPSPRGYASMAYDGASRNVVLFGGGTGYRTNAVSDETWTWDGVNWTLRNPPEPRPAGRQNAVMVYDAHRKEVVMFGGKSGQVDPTNINAGGIPLDDTWTWDGSVWKKLKPPVSPSPRFSASMAYDLCRGEAVLFGGTRFIRETSVPDPRDPSDSVAGETWTWNGLTWTNKLLAISPTARNLVWPPARIGSSMTYSPELGRIVLYGGFTTTGENRSPMATDTDVWMWDGAGWEKYNSELTTAANVAVGLIEGPGLQFKAVPPPRAYASFVAGLRTSGIFLFGGTPGDPATQGVPKPSQVVLPDQYDLSLEQSSRVNGQTQESIANRQCSNPVPIPPDTATGAGQATAPPRKVETREEIKEVAQLPVLLGTTPNPCNPAKNECGYTGRTPQPPCIRGENEDYVKDTHLATDPQRNRVYQFYMCKNVTISRAADGTSSLTVGPGTGAVLIRVYDGTTSKSLGSALAPMPTLSGQTIDLGSQNGNVLHDVERGRFFIRGPKEGGGEQLWEIHQDLIEAGKNPVFKTTTLPSLPPMASFFNHPKTGRAKLLFSGNGSISQFDLDGDKPNNTDWTSTLAACASGPKSGMRTGDRVYTSCVTTTGNKWGVVRISISGDPEVPGTPEVFAAAIYKAPEGVRSWGDPQAERVLLQVDAPNGLGSTLWVFDGKISRYVGRVGLAATTASYWGSGFDQETGRLYMLAKDHKTSVFGGAKKEEVVQGGLMVVDTRLTPVPQVANFGQFSYPSEAQIGTLPPQGGLPRRLFMRRAAGLTPAQYPGHPDYPAQSKASSGFVERYPDGEGTQLPDEMHYLVLSDELPIPQQFEIGQLDALTIPVAETPGKTEVSFDAEGSGYGIRLRSVGGIMSILRPPPQATPDINGVHPAPILTCFGPDRELMAGWVNRARLSDLETSAQSSGLEVDSSSKVDLEGPFSRCQPPGGVGSFVTGQAKPYFNALWPLVPLATLDSTAGSQLAWNKHFTDVECAGDSIKTNQATVTVIDVYGSAVCEEKQARAVGTARGNFGPAPANAVYSVGEGYSKVVVGREPGGRGVVVTSTAVATGIKLPGITIGVVTTTAVSWSNGRSCTVNCLPAPALEGHRASFTRIICDVDPPPPPPVNVNPYSFDKRAPYVGCLDQEAQKKMADDFNARMGINGKMILPTPDPGYLKGSPGGYVAGVTKLLVEELEGQFFTLDSQKEVPGLVIEFYKDSQTQGFGRQILELAGVRGVTGFGVQCGSDFIYSSSGKNCIALTFEDDPVEFEVEDETEFSSSDEAGFDSGGGWTSIEATGPPEGLALGKRLGRFIETLPIIRQLPIRQVGEAALAASVWMLLGMPLVLASRRFAFSLARRS